MKNSSLKTILVTGAALLSLSAVAAPDATPTPPNQAVWRDYTIHVQRLAGEAEQDTINRYLDQVRITKDEAVKLAQKAIFTRVAPSSVRLSIDGSKKDGYILTWDVLITTEQGMFVEGRVDAGTGYVQTGAGELGS